MTRATPGACQLVVPLGLNETVPAGPVPSIARRPVSAAPVLDKRVRAQGPIRAWSSLV